MTRALRTSILGLSLGLLPLTIACGDKDGGGGGDGDAGTDTGGADGSDTGATDGGDTGGTDGDAGTDTGRPPRGDRYTGEFTVRLFASGSETALDSCRGLATVTVSRDATPPISGSANCRFQGDLSATFPDDYGALIEGGFDKKAGDVSGTFRFGLGGDNIIADDWTGSLVPDGPMRTGFGGSAEIDGTTYDYSGGFDVAPVDSESE